jgi:hypothetical protein
MVLIRSWIPAFFLSFSLLFSARAQQTPITSSSAPTPVKPLPFTDQLKKTIVFLRVVYNKPDGSAWQMSGTGFLVVYSDERLGQGQGFIYLVTNRHMVVPGVEVGQHYPINQFYIRGNVKVNPDSPNSLTKSVEEDLHYERNGGSWYFPKDSSVDLAVTGINLSKRLDYMPIPVSLIATKDIIQARQIAPGDQVVFAGYFYQFPGTERVQPIVRQGILAMLPDEPVPTPLAQQPGHVYLVDAHAFHGNSGSPIFVNTGGIRGGMIGGVSYSLLGIVSGYYPESETNFSVPAARVLTQEVHDNSGITVVVPGDELKALLESPEIQRDRDKGIESIRNSRSPN